MRKPQLFNKIYLSIGIVILMFFCTLFFIMFYQNYIFFKNNSKSIKSGLISDLEEDILSKTDIFIRLIQKEVDEVQENSKILLTERAQAGILLAKGLLPYYSANNELSASRLMASLLNAQNSDYIFFNKNKKLLVGKDDLWIAECAKKLSKENRELTCYRYPNKKNEVVYLKYFDSYHWVLGSFGDVTKKMNTLKNKIINNALQREILIKGKKSKIVLSDKNGINLYDNSYLPLDITRKSENGGFIEYSENKNSKNLYAYVGKYPLWDWIVVSSTEMIDFEEKLNDIKQKATNKFFYNMLILFLIFFVMFLLITFRLTFLAKKQKNDMKILENFFENLLPEEKYINTNRLIYEDARSLALKTNEMVNRKILAQHNLQQQRRNISHSDDFFMLVDQHFLIKSASDIFFLYFSADKNKVLQGITLHEVIGKEFFEKYFKQMMKNVLTGKIETKDMWVQNIKNEDKFVHFICSPYYDDVGKNPTGVVVSMKDITEFATAKKNLHETEQKINFLLYYDSITNLPNFTLFNKQLNEMIAKDMKDKQIILYYLKLEGLEKIYNSYGYEYKDNVLISIANKLSSLLNLSNLLTRIGDDEFIAVTSNILSEEEVIIFIKNILAVFENSFSSKDKSFILSVNIGVAIYPKDSKDVPGIIKAAKLAMYQAKDFSQNSYCFYQDNMHSTSLKLINLENDLSSSIKKQEFTLHYQPLINLKNMNVVGFEALLRWLHPKDGIVYPNSFIAHAERTGMIVQIGEMILKKACLDAITLEEEIRFEGRIAINISGVQIEKSDFLQTLKNIISETNVNVARLELEITESTLMKNNEKWIKLFKDIQAMGINIAIDDFGTGYSSLNYLRYLPVDKIKIDRSFIQDVPSVVDACKMVQSIISLGKTSSKIVLAEGVENIEQSDFLKDSGCDVAQGFLYAKPMPIEKLLVWCRSIKS